MCACVCVWCACVTMKLIASASQPCELLDEEVRRDFACSDTIGKFHKVRELEVSKRQPLININQNQIHSVNHHICMKRHDAAVKIQSAVRNQQAGLKVEKDAAITIQGKFRQIQASSKLHHKRTRKQTTVEAKADSTRSTSSLRMGSPDLQPMIVDRSISPIKTCEPSMGTAWVQHGSKAGSGRRKT